MFPVVKRVIPEGAWPRLAGKRVDSQSWDAALDLVQQRLLEMAAAKRLNELADDPVLAEVFWQCQELRGKEYLEVVRTNHELAKKYAISPRTVTNWRKKGCPFDKGQWQVLDWMHLRPYLPRCAQERFARQFWRTLGSAGRDFGGVSLFLKEPVPDSVREICEG